MVDKSREMVPLVVIGEPELVIRPGDPLTVTDVTVPVPAGAAQTPSPLQNVEDEAPVPEFRFETGRFPEYVVANVPVPDPVTAPVSVIVWSPVFVPDKFEPVTVPVDDTLFGVILPNPNVIAGVVVGFKIEDVIPLFAIIEIFVTVPVPPAVIGTFVTLVILPLESTVKTGT